MRAPAAPIAGWLLLVAACTAPPPVPDPARAATVATGFTAGHGVQPAGFERAAAVVTLADGSECELCLWLADDGDRRRRGLMSVTDMGPADGMVFVYPAPHTGRFWMRDTPMPLSIAFFDAEGRYLDAFDMDPCPDGACQRYRTPDDIVVAVEVPRGALADHGLVPGSTLRLLTTPCPRSR